jgi:hypothetical protein
MGRIVEMSLALEQSQTYNVLNETLNELIPSTIENFQKDNPLPKLYVEGTLDKYQESFTDSLGFNRVTYESTDLDEAPISNTKDGFTATKSYRLFNGGFKISERLIRENQSGAVRMLTTKHTIAWERDRVKDGVLALSAGFGNILTTPSIGGRKGYQFFLNSCDTVDGSTGLASTNVARNPLFTNAHTVVKTDELSAAQFNASKQSNKFCVGISDLQTPSSPDAILGLDIGGSDYGQVAKLGSVINKIVTYMEKLKDDNNELAGVTGAKEIIIANDPNLKDAFETALGEKELRGAGDMSIRNQGYQKASLYYNSYLDASPALGNGIGAFIVDRAYNEANNGLEYTQRFPLRIRTKEHVDPDYLKVIFDEGRDINVATWRGIAYLYLGKGADIPAVLGTYDSFTMIKPISTIVKPVAVVGPVLTATPVSTITLSGTQTVASGSNVTFTAAILPADASNQSIVWVTDDATVASVVTASATTATVTGVAAGTTTIRALALDGSGVVGTRTITVS